MLDDEQLLGQIRFDVDALVGQAGAVTIGMGGAASDTGPSHVTLPAFAWATFVLKWGTTVTHEPSTPA